jgi:hypothetical protein
MKRRVRKIANFFAFNLLFFALYLNFIHKDKMVVPIDPAAQTKTAAFSETVLVEHPEQYLNKKNAASEQQEITASTKEVANTPLN